MGKNKQKKLARQEVQAAAPVSAVEAQETAFVRSDLIQTVAVNLIFLALLIGLYYWNRAAGEPLNELVAKFIKI